MSDPINQNPPDHLEPISINPSIGSAGAGALLMLTRDYMRILKEQGHPHLSNRLEFTPADIDQGNTLGLVMLDEGKLIVRLES